MMRRGHRASRRHCARSNRARISVYAAFNVDLAALSVQHNVSRYAISVRGEISAD
jgi:hypothetical protein